MASEFLNGTSIFEMAVIAVDKVDNIRIKFGNGVTKSISMSGLGDLFSAGRRGSARLDYTHEGERSL